MTDLHWQGASKLAALVRSRQVRSRELLEMFVARAQALNPSINAIVCWRLDAARWEADEADRMAARGEFRGPLHGVPFTVKESFDMAGLPSTFGIPELAKNIAAANAVAIDKLQAAGAVIFGKTNVPYALGDFQSYNAIYGTTRNPWDLGRTPGGSSGGASAALAAGLTPVEMGSDIGGSVRSPAHYCGVYAHKPTWGIVDGRGHAPPGIVAPADIAVCGPLAREAGDLALMLQLVAGPSALQSPGWKLELPPARGRSLRDFKVAMWLDDAESPVDREVAEVLDRVKQALVRAGVRVSDTARPDIDARVQQDIYMQLLRAVTTSRRPEDEYREALELVPHLDPQDRSHRAYYLKGMAQSHRSWVRANEERTKLRHRWRQFFGDFDILLCPVSPVTAFPIEEGIDKADREIVVNGQTRSYMQGQLFWSGLVGACYMPSTAVPAGLSARGLPVGMQVVGAEFEDYTCIEFARLLAQETGGFRAPPALGTGQV